MPAAYRRVLLKLSGEIFSGSEGGFGIDAGVVTSLATQVAGVQALGVQIDEPTTEQTDYLQSWA